MPKSRWRERTEATIPSKVPPETNGETPRTSEYILLTEHSPLKALTDLRNRYRRTVFFDPYEEEFLKYHAPDPPKWKVLKKELTKGKAKGFPRKMKNELAYKMRYVNESR